MTRRSMHRVAWVFSGCIGLALAGCGGDRPAPSDGGARIDAGGIACGSSTCAVGQVCCIDCDGTGLCGPPGTACAGLACPPDAGTDAGGGVACGATTCGAGQTCCVDCDGSGSCVAPGGACAGPACPPPPVDAGSDAGPTTGTCAMGTCRLVVDGECEVPTGATGNGCCECGEDGTCTNFCRCAAPDTPVATPAGERPIADIAVGDLVLSLHRGELVAVPVRQVHHTAVRDHAMVRVHLDSGAHVDMSPAHPTAGGRPFRDLDPGDALGDARITAIELIPYEGDATYDILPASDTGTYVAAGALVGSTLFPR